MNSQDMIPIFSIYRELLDNYNIVESHKLHSLCRILAIMIFDHKKIEFKQIFKYKDYLKIKPLPKVTTENQSICYHLPNFIEHLSRTLK